jgi:hypothetical protein
MHGADRSFYIERACSRTNTRPSELMLQHCMTAVETVEPLAQFIAAYGADNYVIGTDFSTPRIPETPQLLGRHRKQPWHDGPRQIKNSWW